jgi:hypothetical protein
MLSDGDRRPERRSDHGQMILKVFWADMKPVADLLLRGAPLRGAPLRDRTVDLLPTMQIELFQQEYQQPRPGFRRGAVLDERLRALGAGRGTSIITLRTRNPSWQSASA